MNLIETQLTELKPSELLAVNGGGLWFDIYKILAAEGKDFVRGFMDGLNS